MPRAVSDALERVEIDSAIGERGTFRLTFRLDDPTLPERFLLDSGDLFRVLLVLDEGRAASVVSDGVMVVHTVAVSGEGTPTLVVSGEDLTLLMDLLDVARPFPAMPVETRVRVLLAGYAPFGIVPLVVPPPFPSTPIPTERIPHQQGTDYDYIRSLADAVGFRFRWTRARREARRSRTGDPNRAPIARARRSRSISTDPATSRACN